MILDLETQYPPVVSDRQEGKPFYFVKLGEDNWLRVPFWFFWLLGGHR